MCVPYVALNTSHTQQPLSNNSTTLVIVIVSFFKFHHIVLVRTLHISISFVVWHLDWIPLLLHPSPFSSSHYILHFCLFPLLHVYQISMIKKFVFVILCLIYEFSIICKGYERKIIVFLSTLIYVHSFTLLLKIIIN